MTIRPTNDLLLVRRVAPAEVKTSWGFTMQGTEENLDTPWEGVIVYAGKGRKVPLTGPGEAVLNALQGVVDALGHMEGPELEDARSALRKYKENPPLIPLDVKVGDRVVFSKNGYQSFKINGETLLGMQEASILGVLED